ncbi:hypothetical protein QZH41_006114 [Actinostola sp. cb2023]|nr:hypothetical protein QZH41_006114 [Actinostola sp. cb2023]
MAGNLNEKLQQILKKLEKLDTIEKSTSKIESSLKELEIRMAKMEEFKITASKDIQELKDGLSYVGDQVQEAKLDEVSKNLTQIDELKKESSSKLEELTTQNLYLEAYSRRENIKFFNIEETPRENVEEVLRDFLEEELGHQDAREIEIQRVHRVGKTKGDKPRPILARFLSGDYFILGLTLKPLKKVSNSRCEPGRPPSSSSKENRIVNRQFWSIAKES